MSAHVEARTDRASRRRVKGDRRVARAALHKAGNPVYMDNQATTPIDPRVLDAMLPFFGTRYGNPHSNGHSFGWDAFGEVENARALVAHLVNADDHEIVFTAGATESCNIALQGVANAARGRRRKVVTVATEHSAVLETATFLGKRGFEPVILPVDRNGILDLGDLVRALDDDVLIVSVMAVNNEIGVIQDMEQIGRICARAGVLFHSDATQAAGRMKIDVDAWGVHLLSISGHKMYGPKGIGALYVKSGTPVAPILAGGGQERGLRPGTIPVPLVAGLGKASDLAADEWESDTARMDRFDRRLLANLHEAHSDMVLFGHDRRRVAGSICVGFPGIAGIDLVSALASQVAISTGAACTSVASEPSRVLLALGHVNATASTGVRISLGRFTTDDHVEVATASITEAVMMATDLVEA